MSDTLSTPIDATLIDTAAEVAYLACMEFRGSGIRIEPWAVLPEYWKRIYRAQARAVIELVTL